MVLFSFEDFVKKFNSVSKQHLEKLYSLIEDYFENCDKYGLELRDGQYQIALSVYEAIESQEHLVIEAGVGIGKSFAYLIPLMYYYELTGRSFIISTSTIALQEQLEKDIKRLSSQLCLSTTMDVVVAKGMSNFLCLNRIEQIIKNDKNDKIIEQINISKQDRKDYPNIKDNEWQNICVNNCTYSKCTNHSNCEFYKRREKMVNADGAIICNHDLLILDLTRNNGTYGKQLLKKVNFIVCDEAHNLESKIRNFYTKEIYVDAAKNILKEALKILENLKVEDYDYDSSIKLVNSLSKHIADNANKEIEKLKNKGIDLVDCNGLTFTFDDDVRLLSKQLDELFSNIKDSIQIFSKKDTEELEDNINEMYKMFKVLADGKDSNYLFWIVHRRNKNYIYYAPKDIDKIAFDIFFDRENLNSRLGDIKTFIFTSATLSIGKNNYSYFLNNIGANRIEKKNDLTIEYSYESPYNYDENALLYCCNDIESPSINKEKYLVQLVNKIKELIRITNGKTLVLFTSKSDMNYVYKKIGNKLDDINIYIQNDGSSQDKVKEQFKNDINSVLFSTGIFWEGIDIKGKALSNLIIARLPFPVVDPIMEYKKSKYKNGFNKVYIPEMLIKLKQGIGRLIRSETDKGIICILDSRMDAKYQDVIRQSIPIKNFTTDIEEIKKFVKEIKINE